MGLWSNGGAANAPRPLAEWDRDQRLKNTFATARSHAEFLLRRRKRELLRVPDVMPIVGGKSFRCACGCNVFHRGKPYDGFEVLVCNACQVEYATSEEVVE